MELHHAPGGERAAEWFRVVEFSRAMAGRLHFIEERTAREFADYLLEQGAELVVLERWCEGRRVDSRLMTATGS